MENQTTETTTKTLSVTQWHAFILNPETGKPDTLTFRTHKELKTRLSELEGVEVIKVIQGKNFSIKTRKQFEFVPETGTVN